MFGGLGSRRSLTRALSRGELDELMATLEPFATLLIAAQD
jgi:hypothetical protein